MENINIKGMFISDKDLLQLIKDAVHQIDNVEEMVMRDMIYIHNIKNGFIKIVLLENILKNMHEKNEIENALVRLIKGVPI